MQRWPNTGYGRGHGYGHGVGGVLTGLGASTQARNTSAASATNRVSGTGASTQAKNVSAGSTATSPVWQFLDSSTVYANAGTPTTLATGVLAGAVAYASPDLLPGQSLSLSSGTLSLVNDSTVPTVNGDTPGDVIDAISDRDIVIEVMDSPIAHIRNATQNIEYPYAAPGSWPQFNSQQSNRWNWVLGQSAPGDVIEISPGAVHAVAADASLYTVEPGSLQVQRPINLKNMDGRGRWKIWPSGYSVDYDKAGIVLMPPALMYAGSGTGITSTGSTRGDITIEGFDIVDQFGTSAAGVAMRPGDTVDGSWTTQHNSITFRNFKLGKTSGPSNSGMANGCAETITLEDGHIFDCGDGSGLEHNIYIAAKVMNLRGCRFSRTRGWPGAYWSGNAAIEGHILKVSAVTGTIEGCVLDMVLNGDQSLLLDLKAGGNWTVRGNLFIDSAGPNNANGACLMERELGNPTGADAVGATTNGSAYPTGATTITLAAAGAGKIRTFSVITFAGDPNQYYVSSGDADVSGGGTITIEGGLLQPMTSGAKAITVVSIPNYEWWAGSEGNSMVFEKNVWIGHYPRPIFFFRNYATSPNNALFPSGDTSVIPERRLNSFTVRDNIGMVTSTPATWMLAGFPGANNSMWLNNDPNAGTYWAARNNSIETYDVNEAAFSNRPLKVYTRAAGTIAASGGTVGTRRFTWPHGSIARSDNLRGLG